MSRFVMLLAGANVAVGANATAGNNECRAHHPYADCVGVCPAGQSCWRGCGPCSPFPTPPTPTPPTPPAPPTPCPSKKTKLITKIECVHTYSDNIVDDSELRCAGEWDASSGSGGIETSHGCCDFCKQLDSGDCVPSNVHLSVDQSATTSITSGGEIDTGVAIKVGWKVGIFGKIGAETDVTTTVEYDHSWSKSKSQTHGKSFTIDTPQGVIHMKPHQKECISTQVVVGLLKAQLILTETESTEDCHGHVTKKDIPHAAEVVVDNVPLLDGSWSFRAFGAPCFEAPWFLYGSNIGCGTPSCPGVKPHRYIKSPHHVACEKTCEETTGCNAVNYNYQTKDCVLRECADPFSKPDVFGAEGYACYVQQPGWKDYGPDVGCGCPGVQPHRKINSTSYVACMKTCEETTSCNSVNYNDATKDCVLRSCADLTSEPDVFTAKGYHCYVHQPPIVV